MYTAVANNKNSISLYDVENGGYRGTIFVTTGEIIGQPIVSPKTITVTYTEGGNNYMNVYDSERRNLIRVQALV